MIKEKNFEAFGVKYRTKQFAAARGLELLSDEDVYPTDFLEKTEVLFEGAWLSLKDEENIDRAIRDEAKILAPRVVLDGILFVVHDFNFGFLKNWKGVKVPRKFLSEAKSVATDYADPIIAQLIQDDMASLKELEEYYSLEDAFKLFDILTAKGVNIAYQHEQAERESKANRR
ncbi:hypothetical protein BcepF1.100 [Burkholderia phage BcepF1]|uniref:Uncharacterized protein n=1 Tax=Burkholderia phage BcepF1 TaxID=2886897 RepID=A1Z004_9CAUD|nr:hypothetical protein BcepF1.100 [Burkholderia phage BcepF1]ABL96831.1 hypothetical protein BcepF1.100 [Burkholderia phage BcepF1]